MPSNKIVRETRISSSGLLLPITSALTVIIVIFLIFAFFKGWTYQFYASILFGFYTLTHRMWVSVIFLGVTQTVIMMPLRAIRVFHSHGIKKFQEKIEEESTESEQFVKVKRNFKQGNLAFLFYVVDFMTQLTLFISIGRLFLTDFYTNQIKPETLFSFIPYPEYPLQGLIFKLPYPVASGTRDLGMGVVGWVWLGIIALHIIVYIVRTIIKRTGVKLPNSQDTDTPKKTNEAVAAMRYVMGSLAALLIISYILVRHFPTGIAIHIFSGDVSRPNRTLNTVTAIVTFITFFWFGIQDLLQKGKLAEQQGVPQRIVDKTQQEMFRESLTSSALIGLGAYFITNLIPSAFELSIFTLEIISLLSPLTLDKAMLKLKERQAQK